MRGLPPPGRPGRNRAAVRPAGDDLGTSPVAPRLQLVLARAGVASRRESEVLIIEGRVTVDGAVVRVLGTRVDPARHRVAIDGRPIGAPAPARYLALNKPVGHVTTADDPDDRPTVMRLVPPIPGLFPVGRLDVASEGLLLLTTDGAWAQRASHPRYGCAKEYDVEVVGDASPDALATMRAPMDLGPGDQTTGARVDAIATWRNHARLRVTIHEGRNRQVRRMCAAVGLEVTSLVRVRVGDVTLGALAPGEWRDLTTAEVAAIGRHGVTPRSKVVVSRARRPVGTGNLPPTPPPAPRVPSRPTRASARVRGEARGGR